LISTPEFATLAHTRGYLGRGGCSMGSRSGGLPHRRVIRLPPRACGQHILVGLKSIFFLSRLFFLTAARVSCSACMATTTLCMLRHITCTPSNGTRPCMHCLRHMRPGIAPVGEPSHRPCMQLCPCDMDLVVYMTTLVDRMGPE